MKDLAPRFKVGQTVALIPSISRFAANGHYQITRLQPADGEIPQYRIKSSHEAHERVVAENDLIAASDPS